MPPSDDYVTYRVWGLPANITVFEATLILEAFFDSEGVATEPKVRSLGLDPYAFGRNVEMVATVTFSQTPAELLEGNWWELEKRITHQDSLTSLELTIDTTFSAFTPLNTVKDDEYHKIDCIVVSGLSSHPFGSWKRRRGPFMWLRDTDTWRSPGVRVLLYGYDTSLVRSESFQDIGDIGQKLGNSIKSIRQPRTGEINYELRPLVFIAHSLGGLVVKEAICHMANMDEKNARCVYGLIFFGVPNRGMATKYWLPIVNDQPNVNLVRDLEPGSQYLRILHDRFCRAFTFPTSRVVSVYETRKSETAKWEESLGRWALNGPTDVLVTRDSALDSCPPVLSHNHTHVAMERTHSDLPKFKGRHDSDYQLLTADLHSFWKTAVEDIQSRFESEGSFSRDDVKPSEEVARQAPLVRSPTPDPQAHFIQSYFANNFANHYMGNPYANNLNMLAAGGQFLPNQKLHSLSPFGAGIPHRPRNDQKTIHHVTPDPRDAPHQYEYRAGPEEAREDPSPDLSTAAPPENPVGQGEDLESHQENNDRSYEDDEPESDSDDGDEPENDQEGDEPESEQIDDDPVETPPHKPDRTNTYTGSESIQPGINVCSICGEQFPSKRKLSKHRGLTDHHEPRTEWEQGLPPPEDEPDRTNTYTGSESIQPGVNVCSICGEQFPSKRKLSKHRGLTDHHEPRTEWEQGLPPPEDEPDRTNTYTGSESIQPGVNVCSICGEQFPSKRKLSKHRGLTDHHEPRTEWEQGLPPPEDEPDRTNTYTGSESIQPGVNVCSICGEQFPSKRKLSKHRGLTDHHEPRTEWEQGLPPPEDEPDRTNTYTGSESIQPGVNVCSICGEQFPSKRKLSKHRGLTDHHEPRTEWEQGLPPPEDEPDRTNTYTGSESIQPGVNVCSICGEQFPSKRKLSKHRGLTDHHEPRTEWEQSLVKQPNSDRYYQDASERNKQTINPLQCIRCNEIFPSRTQLSKHIKASRHFHDNAEDGPSLRLATAGGNSDVSRLVDQASTRRKDKRQFGTRSILSQHSQAELCSAAEKGDLEKVAQLLEEGVDIETRNVDHRTPLHSATNYGHLEVVQLLLGRGANIEAKDTDSWRPLHFAAKNGHLKVVQLLLEHRAKPDAKEIDNWTPLHMAALMGHQEVARLLLKQDISLIEAKNMDNSTALHIAAERGQNGVVAILVKLGANTGARDNNSCTPLDYAEANGLRYITWLLRRK